MIHFGQLSMKKAFRIKHFLHQLKKISPQKQLQVCIISINFSDKLFSNYLAKAPVDSDTESSAAAAAAITQKKTKEFRVLDPRAGQNYGLIILFNILFYFI